MSRGSEMTAAASGACTLTVSVGPASGQVGTPYSGTLDTTALARTGGVAFYFNKEPRLESVGDRLGALPWAEARSGRARLHA